MEMGVTVGAASDEQQPATAATKKIVRGPNSSDLDAWLDKVEALGELKRITAEVDPDLEAATITYLVGSENSPALLFENIKGHPGHRALYNMIGCNLSRFCLMIGEEPVDHPLKAVQILQQKLGRKMPPKEVSADQAICNQNIVEGDEIDIRMFPAQRMWPLDGGHVSRHRRRRGHQGPGDRPHQRRHLSHDDQGPARDRRLHLARQGRHHRPREVVEDGQADADRRRLRHRSAAVPGRRDEPAEDRERIRLLFGASTARRSSCSPATSPACRCRRAPRSSSKAFSIPTRPLPRGRSASSPAITAGRAAPRPTCGSSACAIATIRP